MDREERLSLRVALFGGLISISNSLLNFLSGVFAAPDLEVEPSRPLVIKYNPNSKIVAFEMGVLLNNDGDEEEVIRDVRVEFFSDEDAGISYSFTLPRIDVRDGDNLVPLSLPISGGEWRSFIYEASGVLSPRLMSMFELNSTGRVLSLVLLGEEERVYSVTYNFDISPGLSSLLRGVEGGGDMVFRLENTYQGGG